MVGSFLNVYGLPTFPEYQVPAWSKKTLSCNTKASKCVFYYIKFGCAKCSYVQLFHKSWCRSKKKLLDKIITVQHTLKYNINYACTDPVWILIFNLITNLGTIIVFHAFWKTIYPNLWNVVCKTSYLLNVKRGKEITSTKLIMYFTSIPHQRMWYIIKNETPLFFLNLWCDLEQMSLRINTGFGNYQR